MKSTRLLNLVMATTVVVVLALPVCAADMPTEPRGGKPPTSSRPSVENLADQVTYQRAFEAVVWSMPAMIKYGNCRRRRITLEQGV